ncbi:MAG: D-alanyl-D-alanine carboxypeptidase, partial [Novosphingobium sp.]
MMATANGRIAREAMRARLVSMRLPLIAALSLLATPLPAFAAENLQQQVAQVLAEAGPGTRWGVVVADMDGKEIIAIDPEGRYVPASNTKLFTTAAAFWKMGETNINSPDRSAQTLAALIAIKKKLPDLVLFGRGDARLSSAKDCKVDCLNTLVDGIANRTRRVGNIIGDDSMFLDQRWSPGMSWNNIQTDSGTGISALSIDNNEAIVTVSPSKGSSRPIINGPAYFTYENGAWSYSKTAGTETDLLALEAVDAPRQSDHPKEIAFTRMPGSKLVRITGDIKVGSPPLRLVLGIDDPAEYTAWAVGQALRERGVVVVGTVTSNHWMDSQTESSRGSAKMLAFNTAVIPALSRALETNAKANSAPPLSEDLTIINKQSQNLHAELLLRRLVNDGSDGSIEGGQKVVTAMLT